MLKRKQALFVSQQWQGGSTPAATELTRMTDPCAEARPELGFEGVGFEITLCQLPELGLELEGA